MLNASLTNVQTKLSLQSLTVKCVQDANCNLHSSRGSTAYYPYRQGPCALWWEVPSAEAHRQAQTQRTRSFHISYSRRLQGSTRTRQKHLAPRVQLWFQVYKLCSVQTVQRGEMIRKKITVRNAHRKSVDCQLDSIHSPRTSSS